MLQVKSPTCRAKISMTLQEKRNSMLALVESWRESDKTQIEFARENGLRNCQ